MEVLLFTTYQDLEVTNLSNNTIHTIGKFAFIYLPNLKSVNLTKNYLNEIDTNFLEKYHLFLILGTTLYS